MANFRSSVIWVSQIDVQEEGGYILQRTAIYLLSFLEVLPADTPSHRIRQGGGKLEGGTVKAIITQTDGLRYQIDLGGDRTALVHEWQIRKE